MWYIIACYGNVLRIVGVYGDEESARYVDQHTVWERACSHYVMKGAIA